MKTVALLGAAVLLDVCGSDHVCPVACTKPAEERISFNKSTGFTDNTGFVFGSTDECCDICAIPNAVITPKGRNATYDWDFIVMDSMYMPQFCNALSSGHDFTVTNVAGSKCLDSQMSSGFQIHGLWPDYDNGFAACCLKPAPLDPKQVEAWTFHSDLQSKWADAAVDSHCGTCFNLNHEWQKHGSCFTDTPQKYFEAGLAMTDPFITAFNALTRAMAMPSNAIMSVTTVRAIWSNAAKAAAQPSTRIGVMCDSRMKTTHEGMEVTYFSELQICWKRKPGIFKGVPLTAADIEPVDCPADMHGACNEVFAVKIGPAKLASLLV